MNEDLSYQVELLERVKEELGMSQSDIARKFDIGNTTVSDWVKEKRKITTTAKLALEFMLKDKKQQKELEVIDSFMSLIEKYRKK
jgi:plasmid maintenance system antidote protein VapI